jgi:AraC-like DNA-binding protein
MRCLRERTFPNGLLEIIVHLGDRYSVVEDRGTWVCPTTSVGGLQLRAVVVEAPARRTRVLGVRLTPAGAYALLARPMHELTSLTVDLEDVAGQAAGELAAQCDGAQTPDGCIKAALQWIQTRLARRSRLDPAVEWLLSQIRVRAGVVSIARLREQTGWSKTRLASTFLGQVGISPKQYARVMRFTHVVQRIHAGPSSSFADIAVECGYYDQPHMNAEFKELSGFTPTEFQRAHHYPNSVTVAEQ